jgi:hypothetical protein
MQSTKILQAQIRLQTQPIDSAVQLLKVLYDAVMTSPQMSECNPFLLPYLQESRAATQQMTFDAQFELSGAELFGDSDFTCSDSICSPQARQRRSIT